MAEIKQFHKAEKHLSVVMGDESFIVAVSCVRKIARGEMSIAEMDDPERSAQAFAVIAMESIDGN